jgi:beta-galactosidase
MARTLFNFGWEFCKKPLGTSLFAVLEDNDFSPVELPHDWLIFNTQNLYETVEGWYRKRFFCARTSTSEHQKEIFRDDMEIFYIDEEESALLNFEGVYMNSTIYLNGREAFCWKYGYSSFTFDAAPYLKEGENEIVVRVVHQSPNSRWYSGAGLYRNIWLSIKKPIHFYTDGIYVVTKKNDDHWIAEIDSAIILPENTKSTLCIRHQIAHADGTLLSGAMDSMFSPADVFCPYENKTIRVFTNSQKLAVVNPALWDIDSPTLYTLTSELVVDGKYMDSSSCRIGFCTKEFTPEEGFLLNGRKLRLNGACEHHDLGALGSAVNKTALHRQLSMLKEMGVNAIRTSHNMPAVELMELADEMGILIDSEAFDMWERPKTAYDYARFFKERSRRDVASWIRRDRNHVSVILWSIGNEIYDTHADMHGEEITRTLCDYVRENDPKRCAPITIGSNYMPWEGAQNCADIVKYAGYNYSEHYYEEHHKKHPDWVIYGSETASVVQSRGIYHFPYQKSLLADDDEQCSSLGNSSTSWGAKNTIACIADDRDTPYSAGQFIWTGFDYIGEPTPYHTKNSYFGQIDTAGFPKDSFYIFQAEWTDYKKNPMVHLFPYWDFNTGQPIDVLVCSNAPMVELFFNGKSLGKRALDHKNGRDDLIAHWQIPYEKGTLCARAYDEDNCCIATEEHSSFGDAASLVLTADREVLRADGRDLSFVTIRAVDGDGNFVENANLRVEVSVSGVGRLLGLDNGDSTDFDQYKCTSRRLFSGKLLAIIGAGLIEGEIRVQVKAAGLLSREISLFARALTKEEIKEEERMGTRMPKDARLLSVNAKGISFVPAGKMRQSASGNLDSGGQAEQSFTDKVGMTTEKILEITTDEIPIRKLELITDGRFTFSPEKRQISVVAKPLPENADRAELIWKVTTDTGIESNLATLSISENQAIVTAQGDGEFLVRCMTKNNTDKIRIISQLAFSVRGLGSATITPYQFVSAGLYDIALGTLTNGNERGIATSNNGDTTFGFTNVDFGDFGSDEVTIPIFALSGDPYPLQIWEGIPGSENCELLADVVYQKPSIWNVYQEETFHLNRRLNGIATICFTAHNKIHVKGFCFAPQKKAWAKLMATENNRIYGDMFTAERDAVTGIGNNVSLEYDQMDFGEKGATRLFLCGRTPLEKNTIHVRFLNENGEESKQIAEFQYSDTYAVQEFALERVTGCNKIIFVFLPGSNFDFQWFYFE